MAGAGGVATLGRHGSAGQPVAADVEVGAVLQHGGGDDMLLISIYFPHISCQDAI